MDIHPSSSNPALGQTDSLPFGPWLDLAENFAIAPDCLGREAFVKRLCNKVVHLPYDRSVVTAVFGSWGCGKTWLLEKIVENLEKEHFSEISVCRFSPWELKSSDQILAEFFSVVGEKIPSNSPKSRNLASLWERLGVISQIGSAGVAGTVAALQITQILNGEGAKDLTSLLSTFPTLLNIAASSAKSSKDKQQNLTLLETKNELTSRLATDLDKPILIIIDDLDRLADTEIQLMVRLLNTTANLPKLHYLIFGDRKQIALALDPISGNRGDLYLEKLIHNTFQVPEPGENRIREQLWQGLRRLASDDDLKSGHLARRFSELWDHAIKYRLRQLRDCHRLLRTLHFHVEALTRNGVLEVDLADLLAVDFIRVFDPDFYTFIASDPPTGKAGTFIWSATKEKADSVWLLDLIERSHLEKRTIVGILIFLFPNLTQFFRRFLEENQLDSLPLFFQSKPSLLGARSPERTHFYFTLLLSGSDMPEANLREFVATTGSVEKMIQMLESFRENGWLQQLLGRLCSDESIFSKLEECSSLLHAISTVSDSFKSSPGPVEDELGLSFDLCRVLIRRMASEEMESFLLPAIKSSPACTLPLALIEFSRSASRKNYGPSMESPHVSKPFPEQKLEDLSDLLLLRAKEMAEKGFFFDFSGNALRSYRLANALGPKRSEDFLRAILPSRFVSDVTDLAGSIAISIIPRMRIDWAHDPTNSQAGTSLLSELRRFASDAFWSEYIEAGFNEVDQEKLPWLPHLKAALATPLEE